MANKKISELPYINSGEISGNTLVPLVTYFSAATGDTVHTYITDLQNYLTSGITGSTASGNYLPLSGGTVSGGTIFTAGITANTISATTYQNLPPATFSGGTVTGPTIFTNGLTANTISATTYLNLPGGLSGEYLPLSGGTVSGATRFLSGLTANTISADTLTVTDNISSTNRTLYRAPSGGFLESVDYGNSKLWGVYSPSIDWELRQIFDEQGTMAINYSGVTRYLMDDTGQQSVDWQSRKLYTFIGDEVFDWENGILTGQTNIQSSTISATTYLNLPASLTGQYLPLSGGTVSGTTYFTQGVSGSTVSATTFNFNTTFTGSTLVGQMTWNQDFGVPQVGMVGGNVVQKVGENVFAYVKNVETSTLTKGEVVYIFGASGDKISVKRASNTGDTTSSKTLGVVAESITAGSLGYVITQGTLDGLNLGAYTAGDILWLSSVPGQFTTVKQYAPYHLVFIGVVQRANAGNGQLYVLPQNGYELDELHNVAITGATFGDILTYSASGSNNLWVSTKTLNGSYTITGNTTIGGNLTATTISATTYQNLPTDIRVTGASYSNNTFTYTNNTGGTFNVLFNTVTGLTVNGNLTVTGNTNVRAFTGTTGYISGSGQNILTVIGSGNSTTSPLFSVQGSSGELFSVTDSLVGSLFSVNDISGLPIMEVFSDNTTLWGSYQAPSLNTTTRTSLTAGTNTIYSIPTSAYTGAFYEYTLISTGTTGARAGQIMSIWSGSTANFTETSTTDIGTTTGVTFTVAVSGNNAVLSSSATTAGWTVKTIIRSI
jgi:hypothetical protein